MVEEKWRAAVALGGEADGGAGCVLTGHRGGAVVFFLEKWGDRLRAGKKKTPGGKKERKKIRGRAVSCFFLCKKEGAPVSFNGERREKWRLVSQPVKNQNQGAALVF